MKAFGHQTMILMCLNIVLSLWFQLIKTKFSTTEP